MGIEAKIIADSISPAGARITTFEVVMHRFILPEFSRHRAFSLSVSSSRATPLQKAMRQVENEPAMPVFWGRARSGMQSTEELGPNDMFRARGGWLRARDAAIQAAMQADRIGLHKQTAARLIEPYTWSRVLCTSTDYANFFALRLHKDAQPEMQAVAVAMARALRDGEPQELLVGQWHLPYIADAEILDVPISSLAKISAARCARVSYSTHDGRKPAPTEDLKLYERLVGSEPKHASPTEHQAMASFWADHRSGNLVGWEQHRKLITGECAPLDFDWRSRLVEYDGCDYIV